MKTWSLLPICGVVFIIGCSTNQTVSAMQKGTEAKEFRTPQDSKQAKLAEALFDIQNRILHEIDPDEIIPVDQVKEGSIPIGAKSEDPEGSQYVFVRAGFGMRRMISVHDYSVLGVTHPGIKDPELLKSLSSEYREALKNSRDQGFQTKSYLFNVETGELSYNIEMLPARTVLEMTEDQNSRMTVPRSNTNSGQIENDREQAKATVTAITASIKEPVWNGYLGSDGETSLFVYPVKAQSDECLKCHGPEAKERPISHLVYLVSKS